jgi:hypothetical protein
VVVRVLARRSVGGAGRERGPLLRRGVAERALEVGAEPLGVVAAHPGGRGGEALGAGLRGDQLSFANLGRVAVAGPAAGDVRVDGGQQGGARAVVVSGPGRGLAGAQGVVDAVGDRRTVAGAGEAVERAQSLSAS